MTENNKRYYVILPKSSKNTSNNTGLLQADKAKRLEMKRMRNRVSAVKSRNNSKMRTLKLIQENNSLKKNVSQLKEEVEYLRKSNKAYELFFLQNDTMNENENLFDDILDDLNILCKDE